MKYIFSAIVFLLLFTNSTISTAQDADFVPGWFIVERGCEFSDGIITSDDQNQEERVSLRAGEVIFAYMRSNDTYYCLGPSKDPITIKGQLTKIQVAGKVGILTENVSLMETDLLANESYWVTNIDPATSLATICLSNNQKINIPSKSVIIISKYLNALTEIGKFIPVRQ